MADVTTFYRNRPLVIAHRGACDVAPENTLAAFQAALAAGADAVEMDVTRCATGEIVVIHDSTVDRTTDGKGRVGEMDLATLRELDAGAWFSPKFAGERIPLLQEVLELCANRLRVNIEIKGMGWRGDGIDREIAQLIRARGLARGTLVSSFNALALQRTALVAPELQRGFLHHPAQPESIVRALSRFVAESQALHPHHSLVTERYMRWARRQGYRVNTWTVNEPREMLRVISLGVDGIITNHPALLRRLLSRSVERGRSAVRSIRHANASSGPV